MAESTSVALAAAPTPSSADIARAEEFVRDRFLYEGEDAARALAPGTPRRRALDRALAELDEGAKHPSTKWRRNYSLLLGLERVLSEDEPRLADGTVLSAHQVDALSGTLTALLAEAQRTNGNGKLAAAAASPELLASAAILGPDNLPPANSDGAGADTTATQAPDDGYEDDEPDASADEDEDDEDEDDDLGPVQRAAPDEDDDDDDDILADGEDEDEDEIVADDDGQEARELEAEGDTEEEPRDWVEDSEEDEESLAEQPEDPNAAKRFWFEHATGAGKTVAALVFSPSAVCASSQITIV